VPLSTDTVSIGPSHRAVLPRNVGSFIPSIGEDPTSVRSNMPTAIWEFTLRTHRSDLLPQASYALRDCLDMGPLLCGSVAPSGVARSIRCSDIRVLGRSMSPDMFQSDSVRNWQSNETRSGHCGKLLTISEVSCFDTNVPKHKNNSVAEPEAGPRHRRSTTLRVVGAAQAVLAAWPHQSNLKAQPSSEENATAGQVLQGVIQVLIGLPSWIGQCRPCNL